MLYRAADGERDVVEVERLRDVVERSGAHRLDGALDGLRAADHDDERVGRLRAHVRNHLKPVHALHRDVADDELEPIRAEQRERLFG